MLAPEFNPLLPAEAPQRPYGACTDAGVLVGELLCKEVPTLASGELRIVAIARRPGVLTKVAVHRVAPARD